MREARTLPRPRVQSAGSLQRVPAVIGQGRQRKTQLWHKVNSSESAAVRCGKTRRMERDATDWTAKALKV